MAIRHGGVRLTAALAAALVLAGCGTGGGIGKALLLAARSGSADAVPVSAIPLAEIEALGVPTMRVTVPDLGVDLLMFERDRRGDIVTFAASDGATFTFRGGVLIETRGLGADLMSSSAPSAGSLARGGSHARTQFIIGPEDRTLRRDRACQATPAAAETVVIQGRSHAVRRIDETCAGAEGRIANTYWLQGDVVRKSREWVSDRAGYAQFERITD